ncbi:unnamed protein product, partial [Staurois parvus]
MLADPGWEGHLLTLTLSDVASGKNTVPLYYWHWLYDRAI